MGEALVRIALDCVMKLQLIALYSKSIWHDIDFASVTLGSFQSCRLKLFDLAKYILDQSKYER